MLSQFKDILTKYSEYLNDIWRRVYYTAIIFAIIFAVSFFSAGWIIKTFIGLFHLKDVTMVVSSPFQFLDVSVDVGLFLSIIVCAPLALWFFLSFLRPAVSKKEFKKLLFSLPISFLLFIFGFVYGFFSLYWGLQMLAQVNIKFGLQNLWNIHLFISQMVITAAILGIFFQFPLIMTWLIKLGLLNVKALIKKRRIAWATIFIFVSLLPPTDGVSLIVMTIPLILLYEFVIIWNRFRKNDSLVVEGDVQVLQ
jgi:sec-independent protein translocase protein TatC